MRVVLLILFALLFAAGVGILAARDTGSVVISMSDWNMQTSLVFFIVLLLALFAGAYMVLRMLFQLVAMPEMLRRWRGQRRQKLSDKYLVTGLLALIEGRPHDAEENLIRGVRYSMSPALNYLCAARAAQRQGRLKQRDHYLERASAEQSEDKISLALVHSELQINERQAEMALATLNGLYDEYPAHGQIRLLLLRAYMELHAWQDALALLPVVEKSKLLPTDDIQAMKVAAYTGLLRRAGETASRKRLDDAWREIPKKLRRLPSLLRIYTLEKLKFADTADCEPLLQQFLKNDWDAEIVNLYGLVNGKDTEQQLAFAEDLLSTHPDDAGLFLTLGRLSLSNSLWDKSLSYLKRSLDLKPMPESYYVLARLHEKQGDFSTASGYYQQGLALATSIVRHETVRLQEQEEEARAITAGARQVLGTDTDY